MSKEKSIRKKPAVLPKDYDSWVVSLKKRIAGARQKALLSANAEQIKLYHEIDCEILDRQNRQGWGAKVIDRLSKESDIIITFLNSEETGEVNLQARGITKEDAQDLKNRLRSFEEDWNAEGMELYDRI